MMRPILVSVLALLLAAAWVVPVAADDEPAVPERVRKAKIKTLGKELRKKARSPRAPKYKPEILKIIDSLEVLGGPEARIAVLGAVAFADEEVRDRAFRYAESEPHKSLVKPLAAMLEEKLYREDADVRSRAARALSIVADPSGMGPLTELIRTDEDPEVVAAGAEALAAFSSAPLALRKEAVKRLVNAYTSTWNLMMSIRPEDRVIAAKMKRQYKIYGRAMRTALQSLTGEQGLNRPQEWREWWNAHKKRTDW